MYLISQQHHIKASFSKAGRAHIMSFRRQIYIKEEDEHLLPESLQITCDETTHWIFLSTESAHCFLCKQLGHIAKVYPLALDNNPNNNTAQDHIPPKESRGKRPAPASTTDSQDQIDKQTDEKLQTLPAVRTSKDLLKKPAVKKNKILEDNKVSPVSDSTTIDSTTQVKTGFETRDPLLKQLPLDYATFIRFLDDTYGKSNISQIIDSYTHEREGLIEMLDQSYPVITQNNLKSCIARLKKKIQNASETFSETDSDASSI